MSAGAERRSFSLAVDTRISAPAGGREPGFPVGLWTRRDPLRPRAAVLEGGRGLPDRHCPFPNCRDGVNVDSLDRMSHMAYTDDDRCPATHPVKVSRPRVNLHSRTLIGGAYDPTMCGFPREGR